jgi:MFS family permease
MPPASMVAAGEHAGGHRSTSRGRWIVAAFAITQTVGYGTLYYAFAVLLAPIAADLHASTTAVTGAFTASILAGAAMAIPVGRWLDRRGGRALMTTGSVTATILLVAWSQVRTLPQLYAVLIGIGLASAMVLYEPAFAVVVTFFTPDRRSTAILAITLVAGFASTVFMPLTGMLTGQYGWRTALLVLATIHGAVTIPLHAAVVRRPPRTGATPADQRAHHHRRRRLVAAALRDERFWWLAAAFVAHAAAMSAMTVHLVGFLTHAGHPAAFAATVAGLLGILSVTGRLLFTGAQRRLPVTRIVAAVFALQAAAALTLPVVATTRTGAVACVVAFGTGFGIASLATPILLTDRYGITAYATLAGTLAVPTILARATAPLAAAFLVSANDGYLPLLAAVGAACIVAAAGILLRAATPAPAAET